jgi:hypothetical protein
VAIVRRPPILTVGHQGREIGLNSRKIEASKGFGVVKPRRHRARGLAVLVQNPQIELAWPPVPVRSATLRGVHHRAPALLWLFSPVHRLLLTLEV